MELTEQLKQKVAAYQPSHRTQDLLQNTPVLLLVSISGGGKDTIKHRLLDTGNYHHIISYTTRTPRTNNGTIEQDGVDYHFIDLDTANKMLDDGSYIEADLYANNIYGTGVADVEAARDEGKIATTDMTIEGAFHYLKVAPSVKAVFLMPPSYDLWMERFAKRYGGKLNRHDLRMRMQEAIGEIEQATAANNMYMVVNEDLEETIALVDEIAHGKPIEPHYHKALNIAGHLVARLREELAR